jgi:F0F1-type ATP synthase beta subunit
MPKGSITSVLRLYVPVDDSRDPTPSSTVVHMKATAVHSRSMLELAIHPVADMHDFIPHTIDSPAI